MMMKLLFLSTLLGPVVLTLASTPLDQPTHVIPPASGSHNVLRRRGGVQLFKSGASPLANGKGSSPFVDDFVEYTLYSKEQEPESNGHAEWKGFLSGWMLVALPIPLPFLVGAIFLNSFLLYNSKWSVVIKRNFMIGLSHGVVVLVVLLRELEIRAMRANARKGLSPHVAMVGLNLLSTLLFGNAGGNIVTKRLMDTSIWATMLYILIHYFQ